MPTKPASESKTLRFNRLAAIYTAAAALAPSIIGFVIDALGDPQIAAAVSDFIPAKHRTLIFLAVAFIARRNTTLRYQTSTAIQGSPAAAELDGATPSGAVTDQNAAKE